MEPSVCPYLGAVDASNRRVAPIEFPSFENLCFATGAPDLVMLGDQATYCLGQGCTSCPRFRAAQLADSSGPAGFVPRYGSAEDAWQTAGTSGILGVDALAALAGDEQARTVRRRWAWVGASLLFTVALLCGSMVAAYTGWQWVSRNAPADVVASLQRTTALAAAATPMQPAVYLVMTATPDAAGAPPIAQAEATALPGATDSNGIGAAPAFPAAVTPTPLAVRPIATPSAVDGAGGATPLPGPVVGGAATPVVDVELLVPTRRPTPEFDLPTSTPAAQAATLPTGTPTLTPTPLGTPSVVFGPDKKELQEGECTLVRWYVQNVREVYYENLPMNGQGEREECIEKKSETYTLVTILDNGQTQVYTTTVAFLAPTATPTPTPSFTPVPYFTPTWTPEAPVVAPPANVFYGVVLTLNGSAELTCATGQTCETALLLTNSGSGADNLSVNVLVSGPFPVLLCRPDGVCGAGSLLMSAVGPGNTAYLAARFTVPEGAAAQGATYQFQAFSEGSGRTTASSPVAVNVIVP